MRMLGLALDAMLLHVNSSRRHCSKGGGGGGCLAGRGAAQLRGPLPHTIHALARRRRLPWRPPLPTHVRRGQHDLRVYEGAAAEVAVVAAPPQRGHVAISAAVGVRRAQGGCVRALAHSSCATRHAAAAACSALHSLITRQPTACAHGGDGSGGAAAAAAAPPLRRQACLPRTASLPLTIAAPGRLMDGRCPTGVGTWRSRLQSRRDEGGVGGRGGEGSRRPVRIRPGRPALPGCSSASPVLET